MHLCIYACTDGPRGNSSGAEECERVPGQRIKPQIKGRRRNCRISQRLAGFGGEEEGGSSLRLESLILNNLAVVFTPVPVGVGVLVLAASIVHMQLTARGSSHAAMQRLTWERVIHALLSLILPSLQGPGFFKI